jgi:Pentapeptide repeats (8 copies)
VRSDRSDFHLQSLTALIAVARDVNEEPEVRLGVRLVIEGACRSVALDILRQVPWQGVILPGIDLANQDLRGLNFRNANLENANFSGALLDGGDFSEVADEVRRHMPEVTFEAFGDGEQRSAGTSAAALSAWENTVVSEAAEIDRYPGRGYEDRVMRVWDEAVASYRVSPSR